MSIDRALCLNLIDVNWSVELCIFVDSTQNSILVCVLSQNARLVRSIDSQSLNSLVLKEYLVVLLVDQDNALLQIV